MNIFQLSDDEDQNGRIFQLNSLSCFAKSTITAHDQRILKPEYEQNIPIGLYEKDFWKLFENEKLIKYCISTGAKIQVSHIFILFSNALFRKMVSNTFLWTIWCPI